MTLEEALDDILNVEPPLKKAAVACIRANREKAIPELLQRVEDTLFEAKKGETEDCCSYIWYPIYLLAEFREPRLFPLLLQLLRLDHEIFEEIFVDAYHDEFPRILATCGTADQLPLLRELALDTSVYMFQRLVAAETAGLWYAHGMLDRNTFAAFMREIITATSSESNNTVLSFAAHCALETGLSELHLMIKDLFDKELIDEHISGDWKQSMTYYGNPDRALREHRKSNQLIHNVEELFNGWHNYRDGTSPPKQSAPSGTKKVGQNDPCLCGSGKKYKKCCF